MRLTHADRFSERVGPTSCAAFGGYSLTLGDPGTGFWFDFPHETKIAAARGPYGLRGDPGCAVLSGHETKARTKLLCLACRGHRGQPPRNGCNAGFSPCGRIQLNLPRKSKGTSIVVTHLGKAKTPGLPSFRGFLLFCYFIFYAIKRIDCRSATLAYSVYLYLPSMIAFLL